MSHLQVGDVVRLTGRRWNSATLDNNEMYQGAILRVSKVDEFFNHYGGTLVIFEEDESEEWWYIPEDPDTDWSVEKVDLMTSVNAGNRGTLPDVPYYQFPGGVEVRDISAHLMSFPSQILQYAARSGRVDGNCKSEDVADKIRDFEKIIDFARWEIERLQQ